MIVIIFGLLCLINNAAALALFSLFVASNYVAWGTPILCRLIWGQERFKPGEFYTGWLSKPIAIVAIAWLGFGLLLSMFPSTTPTPGRTSNLFIFPAKLTVAASQMNYTIALNGFVWIACMTYYFLFARKWFTGPKTTATNVNADNSLVKDTEAGAEPKHLNVDNSPEEDTEARAEPKHE